MNLFRFGKFVFTSSCFVTVLGIISLWVNKFMKDEDLCLVEYKSVKSTPGIELPDVSFCMEKPLLEKKLNELGTNTIDYINHLSAKDYNENLTSINY